MEEQARLTGKRASHRQRGGAMVEFAFVFPILFLLIYGVIVYSYLFVLQSSMNFAAQEGAEAAIAVVTDRDINPNYETQVIQEAQKAATAALSWLPEDTQKPRLKVQVPPPAGDLVTVTVTFNVTQGTSLFPQLTLPFVGTVPPMPDQIVAQATGRI